MIDLFRAFSTTEDFFYDGAFIAKAKYQRFKLKLNEETYRNEVVKSNKRLCIANCSGYIENEIAETLTVYLMMNVTVKESVQTETIQDGETLWRNFSKEEIADFSHLTGDTNSIHLSENPVVQGLFILKELCNKTQTNKIEVKYIYPVYGDNPIYLKHEGNLTKGFSNGILCFQATLF
ncbi:MaoC family dehydratase [Clostridium sp. CM028]|uniref:MaoC family dehydratase n=1 Tax=unclassified Clostridium TaxID=2614128 RepID=UPI001C6DE95B|nr:MULTISPECIES: MaoC family dehydratase [unclassified Clostridium]MBW9143999.1 MaoC family dehydratase [Clostridium sp. CM027]MBW9147688.1 MaoC family dehydratase [Clostridium sp. CM028]UVE41343.1 MaoC family dehydratase [Clostridium sp. CM027]WLC62013.1 MaoC family dehydratase [Clostridium sp. CM028]